MKLQNRCPDDDFPMVDGSALMKKIAVKIQLEDDSLAPVYATDSASGADLFSRIDEIIMPGEWKIIPTGVRFEIPEGFEAQVRPRSGLATKGIFVLNSPGTIDSDYRGEIKVILANFSRTPFEVRRGMRIAQVVFAQVARAVFLKEELSKTKRGEGGFGSTGV